MRIKTTFLFYLGTLILLKPLLALPMDVHSSEVGCNHSQKQRVHTCITEHQLKEEGESTLSRKDAGSCVFPSEQTVETVMKYDAHPDCSTPSANEGHAPFNDDHEALWDMLEIPERKNPLNAYLHFASHQNKIIAEIAIDGDGGTFIREDDIAATIGGKVLQFFLTKSDSFVTDYYSTLIKNYGQQIADEVFPPSVRSKALQFGLSSQIVFDSLREANSRRLDNIIEQLDAVKQTTTKRIQHADSSLEAELSSSGAVANLDQEELWKIANNIKALLGKQPVTPVDAPPDTRSLSAQYGGHAIQLFDVAMTANSSIIWARRGSFAIEIVRRIFGL